MALINMRSQVVKARETFNAIFATSELSLVKAHFGAALMHYGTPRGQNARSRKSTKEAVVELLERRQSELTFGHLYFNDFQQTSDHIYIQLYE